MSVTVNITGGQVNIATDNATINKTQNNVVNSTELKDIIVKRVKDMMDSISQQQAKEIFLYTVSKYLYKFASNVNPDDKIDMERIEDCMKCMSYIDANVGGGYRKLIFSSEEQKEDAFRQLELVFNLCEAVEEGIDVSIFGNLFFNVGDGKELCGRLERLRKLFKEGQ